MKIFKKIVLMLVVLALTVNSIIVFADDNEDNGWWNTNSIAKCKNLHLGGYCINIKELI